MELLFGVTLLIASFLAFYIALPRDGQVVHFLRKDYLQAGYVVLILGTFVVGTLGIIVGLTDLDPFGQFK